MAKYPLLVLQDILDAIMSTNVKVKMLLQVDTERLEKCIITVENAGRLIQHYL